MNKKFISVLIGGMLAVPTAFAETANITVYALADASLDHVKVSGSTTATNDIGAFNRVSTNSSYLGFKGAADLGDGLKALYQYESSIGFDVGGAASTTLAGRDSYAGLNGGFGQVIFGNISGPSRVLGVILDGNAGATGIGYEGAVLGKLGNRLLGANGANSDVTNTACTTRSATCTSTSDSRLKNALQYSTPNLGGVTGTVLYVADENKTNNAASGTAAQRDTKLYDAGVKWDMGPAMVDVTRNSWKVGDTKGGKVDVTRLAGWFKADFGRVAALYETVKASNYTAAGDDAAQKTYGVLTYFNLGSNDKLIAQHLKAKDVTGSLGASGTGATLTEVGLEHSLSKTTMVKAVYAQLKNGTAASYDFGVNDIGTAPAGSKLSGIQLGVRAAF